ncbi:hypothetical protein [Campylobacter concisus]|jgi:hypothetical protein|uniref:hypothetical protein n=1 Tax=Campylobacter concisus TaxID=199 RepID=UPI000CD8E65A|nr:hypothetical protein [Campylobacter concisus]
MFKKFIIFAIAFSLIFSGCASKTATSKKIDDLRGLYKYNNEYYVIGDKYSFSIKETADIDEIRRFFASEFAKDVKEDFATVCIYEKEQKIAGSYVIAIEKEKISDEKYIELKKSFNMFNPLINKDGSEFIKSLLKAGYVTSFNYLNGNLVRLDDEKRKEILKSGKFQNPIKVFASDDCTKNSSGSDLNVGSFLVGTTMAAGTVATVVAFPMVYIAGAAFYALFFIGWGLACALDLSRCS